MAVTKKREAIKLVLRHNSRLKYMLFDFGEPFKIDLKVLWYVQRFYKRQFITRTNPSVKTVLNFNNTLAAYIQYASYQ